MDWRCAQVAKPVYRNYPSYEHEVRQDSEGNPYNTGENWQIYALGYLTGDGNAPPGKQWLMNVPDASVTDPIFQPTSAGGLGADKEAFYDRFFSPKPLNHYPERDSRTGWCAAAFSTGMAACTGCPPDQSSCRGCAVKPSTCFGSAPPKPAGDRVRGASAGRAG